MKNLWLMGSVINWVFPLLHTSMQYLLYLLAVSSSDSVRIRMLGVGLCSELANLGFGAGMCMGT